jgi:DNA polymerase-3 subunit beta
MKIKINKETLEKAVNNICRVINTKNALPILGDIRFKCEKQIPIVHVMGSDSEVWLKYDLVTIEQSDGGEFCVDAGLLQKALKNLPEQPLEIVVQQGGEYQNMAINHQTGHTIIPVESADEYPLPIELNADALPCLAVDADLIKKPMKRCMYAVTDDPLRPVMNTIYFDNTGDSLNIVASNGHVLVKNEECADRLGGQASLAFMVPKKAALAMLGIMGDLDGEDDILFHVDERQVQMESDNISLTFRTPEGKYPNYESVMPVAKPYFLNADRLALIQAIKNVSPFASGASNMVTLHIEQQKLTIHGNDQDFSTSATDSLDIETNLQDGYMNIGVKASTMIESLRRLAEINVEVAFSEPSRAITISPLDPYVSDEIITMLVMPMTLS